MGGQRIAAIVLAAGGARRMGTPKMLAPLWGRPLVCHAVDAVLASRLDACVVVAGADCDAIREALSPTSARVIQNPRWAEGLSTSIHQGLAATGEAAAVVVVLGDQPALTPAVLDALVSAFEGGAEIAACDYGDGTTGPPALFAAAAVPMLARLDGDQGARALLSGDGVVCIPFPGGRDDVDTPVDLERLSKRPTTA